MAFSSPTGLSFDKGHLDLSFSKRDAWSKSMYAGHEVATPKMIFLGDEATGPMLFLNAVGAGPEGAKTATHYHGSDQFRLILRGAEQSVNRLTFHSGEFAFQQAGMPYKEGVGGADEVWTYLVLGDRRGASAVMPMGDNSTHKTEMTPAQMEEMMEVFGLFTEMAKSNPGGPKGLPSVASTLGQCRNGFLCGSFAVLQGARPLGDGVVAAAGLWGDRTNGPMQLMIKAEPGRLAVAAQSAATETLTLVVSGSCTIGTSSYARGDLRIQAAGTPQAAVVAGPEGAEIIFLIADRRALPVVDSDDKPGASWGQAFKSLPGELGAVLSRQTAEIA